MPRSSVCYWIYILSILDSGTRRPAVLAGLLGCVVVIAWMCRPTAASFGVAAAAYLALTRPRLLAVRDRDRGGRQCFRGLVVVGVPPGLAGLLPAACGGTRRFGEALLGHLISPSRGLFIFSPVLLLTLGGIIRHRRSILREPLGVMALVWIAAFWLVIARFPHWWGGYCYGSRLLVDTMPAWALLTILVWRQDSLAKHDRGKSVIVGLWVVAAVWGFRVNTTKGLQRKLATVSWNERPDIDTHPELLFDWRYPQFLATEASLGKRELRDWLSGGRTLSGRYRDRPLRRRRCIVGVECIGARPRELVPLDRRSVGADFHQSLQRPGTMRYPRT